MRISDWSSDVCSSDLGFIIDDFTYDPAAGTLTCPAGITRTPSPKGNVTYGAACRGCPLREQCTTSASGRTVLIGEHHQLQREHRKRAGEEKIGRASCRESVCQSV